jgi:hypothetical protein
MKYCSTSTKWRFEENLLEIWPNISYYLGSFNINYITFKNVEMFCKIIKYQQCLKENILVVKTKISKLINYLVNMCQNHQGFSIYE